MDHKENWESREQDLVLKMKSNISEGDMGNDMGIDMTGIWKADFSGLQKYRVFRSINYGFDIIMEYLSNFGLTKWTGYKRMMGFF
ncbi:hypothetical protein HID58_087930 [Brassica napus]|uniref:Uncharacterized protein n=1 Tax=Brassica napus TaxID=3708 RepID=A0ABQ7XUQ3_BRANA|nr:hypothetical protein HID58_087930 [Brassica napus]